jgi:L-lactate dehydrogenase complex protein LldF
MSDSFQSHIQTALEDGQLQSALDANTERRLGAYYQAFESLAVPLEDLRQRAHAMRAQTLSNLDHHLDTFVANAQAHGMTVHRAADAAEAREIVLEIAQGHDARVFAKSKTMVSEEIGLNHHLEAHGIQAVETDLGEYIVQLRGEPPAHIITPAVHLSRSQVGHTFEEKLGLPYTEEVPVMTAAVRRILRQTFLSADIGLSGVNFGVAESGGLCIVTNEGNGRMVTTVPPVHIALMGIERLVPTFEDLALVLALLPRAATGQKITVYTSLIHGPRRSGEVDGPLERHVILVDNGRSRLVGSPLHDALLCIRCGACLNACPVFREIGGHAYVGTHGKSSTYPGPIGSIVSPALFGQSEFGQLARASSLCGACKEICPVDIDLPKLLLRVRAGGVEINPQRANEKIPLAVRLGLRVYTWFATRPGRFMAAQKFAAVAGWIFSRVGGWMRLPAFTGWGYSKDFPAPARHSFRERWAASGGFNGSVMESDLLPAVQTPHVEEPTREPQREGDDPREARQTLIERFKRELVALDGTVTLCDSHERCGSQGVTLVESLVAFLCEKGVERVQAWEGEYLPAGLLPALQDAGVQVSQAADPQAQAGLTGSLAAIAETGTLVLASGPGKPLTASLLPEIHLAILREEDIYPDMQAVLGLVSLREAASVALITGPSRTSDIEMTLTLGVHGPREVHVFCLLESTEG